MAEDKKNVQGKQAPVMDKWQKTRRMFRVNRLR